jgi:hypothetical protein
MNRFLISLCAALLLLVLGWLALRSDGDAPGASAATVDPQGAFDPLGADLRVGVDLEQLGEQTHSEADLVLREALAGPEAPGQAALATPPQEPTGQLAELRGRFLFPDGSPASNVEVKVRGWPANSERELKFGVPEVWEDPGGQTDVDGRFSFRFDPPRAFQFVLDATSQGYAENSWRWSELPPGEITDVGEVVLVRGGRIRGRIVDTQGRPLIGDWRVVGDATAGGEWEGRDPIRVQMKADPTTAEFVIDGLPPGRAELSAHSRLTNWVDGPMVEVEAGRETLADIVYDGPDNSRRITLVTFNRPFTIFGDPAPGSIVLELPGGESVAKKVPGSASSWSFEGLEPGMYDIEIRDPRFERWRQEDVATGTALNVQLVGSAAVQLTVTNGLGEALEDYRLLIRYPKANFGPNEWELRGLGAAAPAGGVYRGLNPTTLDTNRGPTSDRQNTNGDAQSASLPLQRLQGLESFELEVAAAGLAPSQIEVKDLAPGETRAIAVSLQPAAAVQGRILGVEAHEADGVTVVLADASLSAKQLMEYRQGLFAFKGTRALIRETESNSDGSFEFSGLAAGSYRLVARFHHDLHAEFGPFDLDYGQTFEALIHAPAHGSIKGLILAAPEDLEHAWIEARIPGVYRAPDHDWSLFEAEPPPRAQVDAEGNFLLSPLAPGTYELCLHHSLQPLGRKPGLWKPRSLKVPPLGLVVLPDAHQVSVEFDLTQQRRGLIHCQTSVDGQPAVGWRVEASHGSADGAAVQQKAEARTGPSGVAHLSQLQPGAWRIALVDNGGLWRAWAQDPLVLEPGAEVSLSIDVTLYPGQLIVLDARTDQPRSNQQVYLGQGEELGNLKTDAAGRLNLRLPLGSYGMRAGSGSLHEVWIQIGAQSTALEWTPSGPVPAAIRL